MTNDDWVEGICGGTDITHLRGVTVRFQPWFARDPDSDHDHCASCMAGLSESHPADLHEGWTTTTKHAFGYDWLCSECFERFREELSLTVAP